VKSEVQRRARDSFQLLQTNERHPSLYFKSVGLFWSVRVTDAVRALAVKEGNDYVWVWIGTHDEYDRLIGRG
jgi:hypothetical protein